MEGEFRADAGDPPFALGIIVGGVIQTMFNSGELWG